MTGLGLGEDFVGGLGQHERLAAIVPAVDQDPDGLFELERAGWSGSSALTSSIYHATHPATGRAIAEKVIASFAACPIEEVARLAARYAPGGSRS